jgi:hypothetical protein
MKPRKIMVKGALRASLRDPYGTWTTSLVEVSWAPIAGTARSER